MAVSGRLYTITFKNVTISAVQDALACFAGSTMKFGLHQINLGQITGTTVANCRVRVLYLPATVTAGSGGSTPTPQKTAAGDAAATVTAHANDTTQATTGGTAVEIYNDVWNTVNGFVWYPPIPGRPPIATISTAVTVSLDTALSSLVCNGTMTVEEI